MAPNYPKKNIGIRPGEKMHEIMCPSDDSHNVIEFKDFFIIKPSIQINNKFNYSKTLLNEKGYSVDLGFEYKSDNTYKLTKKEFLKNVESI